MIVRRTKSDGGAWEKANAKSRSPFPEEFRVGLKPARKDSAADWLVKDANKQGAAIADPVLEVAARGVALAPRTRGPADPSASIDRKQIVLVRSESSDLDAQSAARGLRIVAVDGQRPQRIARADDPVIQEITAKKPISTEQSACIN